MPDLLAGALENDAELNTSFGKLSPGKQREYMEYIAEPKKEATKEKRLEKIIPMIRSGQGLNDRYR